MRIACLALCLALIACRNDKDVVDSEVVDVDEDGDGSPASEDCDDSDAGVYPGAVEVCNGADDDCNGAVDDAVGSFFYADEDGDGYGDPDVSAQSCEGNEGYVADNNDCDDNNEAVNPVADEYCNDIDDDCDGAVDEPQSVDAARWYTDSDSDGAGDPEDWTEACDAPTGTVGNDDDCDDTSGAINPNALEICDGVDNDCDGLADEDDAYDVSTWYADADGDGYGNASFSTEACDAPSGYVADDSDCDDGASDVYPSAAEACDEADNDCDSRVDEGVTTTYYLDADGDGYGRDGATAEACSAPTTAYVASGGDCDDNDTAYNPGATEGCDGEDYDCDGSVDNDADGDGYADISCGGDDCDDSDANILPEQGGSCALGTDCVDLYNQGYTTDGEYTVDPDGYGTGADPVDVYCEQTFDGGGWTAVFNYMDPQTNSTSAAAPLHAALIVNADMNTPVLPDSTSAAIYTSNLDLSQFTEVVYGWAPSDSDDVSHYGTYSDSAGLAGDCYIDGYCGANVAVGSFDIYPTGTTGLTVYTGNQPTYPHVGLGYSGQIILWGYDLNQSSYGPWANWYDTKSCCTSGNTSDITTAGWRYVIYLR